MTLLSSTTTTSALSSVSPVYRRPQYQQQQQQQKQVYYICGQRCLLAKARKRKTMKSSSSVFKTKTKTIIRNEKQDDDDDDAVQNKSQQEQEPVQQSVEQQERHSSSSSPSPPPLVICVGMAQTITMWEYHIPVLSEYRDVLIYEAKGLGPPTTTLEEPPNSNSSGRGTQQQQQQQQRRSSNENDHQKRLVVANNENKRCFFGIQAQAERLIDVIYEAFRRPEAVRSDGQQQQKSGGGGVDSCGDDDTDIATTTITVDVAGFSLGGRIAMAAVDILEHYHHHQQGGSSLLISRCSPSLSSVRIRKLHLTGVATGRSNRGYIQIEAWKDHLKRGMLLVDDAIAASAGGGGDHDNDNDNNMEQVHHHLRDIVIQQNALRAFAWSAITTTYSSNFLQQRIDRIPSWIDTLCNSHTIEGLLALLEETHQHYQSSETDHDDDDEQQDEQVSGELSDNWSVLAIARRLRHRRRRLRQRSLLDYYNCINNYYCHDFRFVVGEYDYDMAPIQHVQKLGQMLLFMSPITTATSSSSSSTTTTTNTTSPPPPTTTTTKNNNNVIIIPNSGHAVPMEVTKLWQKDLLHFLDKQQ